MQPNFPFEFTSHVGQHGDNSLGSIVHFSDPHFSPRACFPLAFSLHVQFLKRMHADEFVAGLALLILPVLVRYQLLIIYYA